MDGSVWEQGLAAADSTPALSIFWVSEGLALVCLRMFIVPLRTSLENSLPVHVDYKSISKEQTASYDGSQSPSFCGPSGCFNFVNMSHLVAKPTKWHVRPAKTQISLGIRSV